MRDLHPIEAAALAAMALLWACVAIVRLLLVPLLAVLLVLLTPPRRRPAAAAAGPVAVADQPALAPVAVPCLADVAERLQALPAVELRRLAGTRARASKAELISRICAVPI